MELLEQAATSSDLLIHTHIKPAHLEAAIWNCMPSTLYQFDNGVRYASIGLHPWFLSASSIDKEKEMLVDALYRKEFVAVGEAGLDKLCDTDWGLQMEAFLFQAELASKLNKPLIIHCVKAHNDIMELKRKLNPTNAWIIHGFRGKAELAEQYIKAGFYLSIGAKFNALSVSSIPLHRLFFETDESLLPIEQTYMQAAQMLSISADNLMVNTRQNADKVFFNH